LSFASVILDRAKKILPTGNATAELLEMINYYIKVKIPTKLFIKKITGCRFYNSKVIAKLVL